MNKIRQINEINQRELASNVSDTGSWHYDYRDTAYIFIGNLPKKLKDEDVIAIFSQYGNPTHLKLIKDLKTGESRGFAYLKYEDHRSCVLAIDNFNGIKVFDSNLKVDHVYYKLRDDENEDDYKVDYSGIAIESTPRVKENKLLEYRKGDEDEDEFKDPMAEYVSKRHKSEKGDRRKRHRNERTSHPHDKERSKERSHRSSGTLDVGSKDEETQKQLH